VGKGLKLGWTGLLEAAKTVGKFQRLGWTGLNCWRWQKQWEAESKTQRGERSDLGPVDSKETQKREKIKIKTKRQKVIQQKQAEILAEVEHGGASYRFACRYEIFRPFRPERNGIYNIAYDPTKH
jgi:hypothetical protein